MNVSVTYTTHTKMFLYNYYIENGSFSNIAKTAPALYKKLLADKKENGSADMNLTQHLEVTLLPHRKDSKLDSAYIRYLYAHYLNSTTLVGADISKGFENKLKETAKEEGITLDEVKIKIDNNELYPELITQIKNRTNIRAYNNLLTIISLNMFMSSRSKPAIQMELFQDFENFAQLEKWEPSYATLLKSQVPHYAGPLTGNEQVEIKVEGSKYYGEDLRLDLIPSLYDDILATFKGYTATSNLTPYMVYRLLLIKRACGNLNRIGLDGFDLLEDLDRTSMNLGFNSIKEMLKEEGFSFTAITADHASFIPCKDDFEVILEDYDESQILIDGQLVKSLKDMNLETTLEVVSLPTKPSGIIRLLAYEYDNQMRTVHTLLTKSTALKFKDNDSLNLTAVNIVE